MFVLHTMLNLPTTFGQYIACFLNSSVKCVRVDFVCHSDVTSSIKEVERNSRGPEDICFAVTGPDQKHALQPLKLHSSAFLQTIDKIIFIDY